MSIQISQEFLIQEAKKVNPSNFKVLKTIKGPGNRDFKIFDLQWYQNELDKFEQFFQGEITLGTIKIVRSFEECEDRISKTPYCDKHFMYKTVVRDTSVSDNDLVASLAMIHGFG